MNRIIIIGNGFDLAHNLPTSYKNFIDTLWFTKITLINQAWKSKKLTDILIYSDNEISISRNNKNRHNSNLTSKKFVELIAEIKENDLKIEFRNNFFEKISKLSAESNWVDIELIYFKSILEIIEKSNYENESVVKLNEEFKNIIDSTSKCNFEGRIG